MRADHAGPLPDEIVYTQRWVHEVFKEAGKGLPWPYQASLMLIEQLITLGMFGGLLASAWFLQELRSQSPSAASVPDLSAVVQALEEAAVGPLPPAVKAVLRQFLAGLGNGQPQLADLENLAAALVAPLSEHFGQAPWPSGAGWPRR